MSGGALIAAVLLSSACGTTASSWLPSSPPVVDVAMSEYHFEFNHSIPRDIVVFRARNAGRTYHRMALVPLPEDFPPLTEELRSQEKRPVSEQGAIPNRPPGGSGTFSVRMTAGRYALICFLVDPDGRSHADKGMAAEFRVR